MRRVLSVASECAPLVKTGGLADVAGALPAALKPLGWETRTLLPGYPKVMAALGKAEGGRDRPRSLRRPRAPPVGDARAASTSSSSTRPTSMTGPGSPYLGPDGKDWPDNPERFAALSWMAAGIAAKGAGGWTPEIVHAHDWQAGLAPYYVHTGGSGTPSILTIHNVAFQGLAPAARLSSLRLNRADFTQDGFEFWGQISALKAGIAFATRVTTVSPTYARELRTEEFGMGLQGMLRARETDLSGILNGIDMETWDPATDPMIRSRYRTPKGKLRNKRALRREFGLPDTPGPLAVVVSRLTAPEGPRPPPRSAPRLRRPRRPTRPPRLRRPRA